MTVEVFTAVGVALLAIESMLHRETLSARSKLQVTYLE